jgi:hypothetical protein
MLWNHQIVIHPQEGKLAPKVHPNCFKLLATTCDEKTQTFYLDWNLTKFPFLKAPAKGN